MFALPQIADEGKRSLYLCGAVTIAFILLSDSFWLETLSVLVFVFLYLVYAEPVAESPLKREGTLYAPISGKILKIEDNPKRIVISKSPLNPGTLRALNEGKIYDIALKHGAFLKRASKKRPFLNERFSYRFKISKDVFKIEALSDALSFFGFEFYKDKKSVKFGEKIGFLSSGEVVVHLPARYEALKEEGDSVEAGITAIAEARRDN